MLKALREAGAKVEKYHGNRSSVSGHPDIYGCYRGTMFLIEAKRPDGEGVLSELQREELVEWALAGARVGHAKTVEEALRIMRGK